MTRFSGTCLPSTPRAAVLLAIFVSSPALADHAAPAGVGGNGASLNLLTPDTLGRGQSSAGFRLSYTRPDQRSDEELADLAGHHVHAHNTDYNLTAAIGAAYGISDRLTVSAELPYVRRDGLREGEHSHAGGHAINEVAQLGNVSGFGDLSIMAKYKLVDRPGASFALVGGLKLPTGSTRRRSREGERLETEHQPGTGSWDPLFGAAFGTTLGPVNFNAGALYPISGTGAQQTRLGDRAAGGIAFSHRFGPPEHHHEEAGHHHHEGGAAPRPHGHSSWDAFVELTGEWEGRQKIAGEVEPDSGGKSVWLSPGARYNSASGLSVAASFGLPVWQDIRASHPDNDYRLTFAVGKAF
jgi:hypothetical protein